MDVQRIENQIKSWTYLKAPHRKMNVEHSQRMNDEHSVEPYTPLPHFLKDNQCCQLTLKYFKDKNAKDGQPWTAKNTHVTRYISCLITTRAHTRCCKVNLHKDSWESNDKGNEWSGKCNGPKWPKRGVTFNYHRLWRHFSDADTLEGNSDESTLGILPTKLTHCKE